MRLFRVVTVAITALVVSTPAAAQAGGRLGMGHGPGQGFRGPSDSVSAFPMSPRPHRRFDRGRGRFGAFGGTAVIPWEPNDIVVPVVPGDPPVFVRNAPPAPEAPVPDAKFVLPPAPGAPEPDGSRQVIVQRGSKIEVQSFPAAR
jgi:hypothetical protein